jgi:hypothetical protein
MNLSISPTKLETFRLHVTEAYNGTITKNKVVEAIKGLTPWSPKMEFGGAFHEVIEYGSKPFLNPKTGLYEIPIEGFEEPFILTHDEVAVADEYRRKYYSMVHEISTKLQLSINGYNVTMSMRIDSMHGLDVHEIKTTDRTPTRDKYEDSIQWRCYALAIDANNVVYDIFKYDNAKPRNIDQYVFTYNPYPTMEQDIVKRLKQFILFCENEGLMEFIKPKY